MTTTPQATYRASERSFEVRGYEPIDFSLQYVDRVFDIAEPALADTYRPFGRCLMIVDQSVYGHYGDAIVAYFAHYGIELAAHPITIRETDKSLRTVERLVDLFTDFGLTRSEPVLVVGGGLITDVTGFACASFRRSTDYVRVPTTLIGLIDASVAIKVAVNHGRYKNRLGAFHASKQVLLDFSFLRTLPTDQIRNGMAELVKIAVVANRDIFGQLETYGEALLETRFGHLGGTPELRDTANRLTYDAIDTMLRLEVPNLHEFDLDRVIAYGHTWSPTLELSPEVPFFHGHAISIDMAFSATLAAERGYITGTDRDRVLGLFSRLGLTMTSPLFTPEVLHQGTQSIVQTRGGLLRAAMPSPIGSCRFVNDLTEGELESALAKHNELCAGYARSGAGEEAFAELSRSGPEAKPAYAGR